MALTDHVAILLGHSLDVARLNKKKTRADFYAQFAFPPAAAPDVGALVAEIYPGVPLATIEVNFTTNAQQPKPFAGVPADWYVIRLASQFAPELYAVDGSIIPNAEARQKFFAGQRVRVHSSAWGWKNEFGKTGASFNLLGVMDAGQGGERLAIGGGQAAAAFKAHANPAATSSGTASNPFGQQAQVHTAPVGVPAATAVATQQIGNPFAASAGASAQSANPFAQQAGSTANPFAQ